MDTNTNIQTPVPAVLPPKQHTRKQWIFCNIVNQAYKKADRKGSEARPARLCSLLSFITWNENDDGHTGENGIRAYISHIYR